MTLPLPTRIVIGAAGFVNAYWWALIADTVGGGFAIKKYYGTSSGQLVIDRFMLYVPVLGDVLRKSAVSRFTGTLGTLISSGVSKGAWICGVSHDVAVKIPRYVAENHHGKWRARPVRFTGRAL